MSQSPRQHPDHVQSMMAADEATLALGIELVAAGAGRAVARMRVRAELENGHAIAQGRMVFALADTAFGCACNTWGPATVASSAEIVFVAPARLGDHLSAEAPVRTRFGRHGLYDVTIRRGDDVIAEFRRRSTSLKSSP